MNPLHISTNLINVGRPINNQQLTKCSDKKTTFTIKVSNKSKLSPNYKQKSAARVKINLNYKTKQLKQQCHYNKVSAARVKILSPIVVHRTLKKKYLLNVTIGITILNKICHSMWEIQLIACLSDLWHHCLSSSSLTPLTIHPTQ